MNNFQADIDAINSIPVVPTMLEVICRTTGMGFAAIARVTDEKWIACSVRDEINFGLQPGGELKLETTICHEIRQSGEGVIIDHVAEDEHFRTHHTPLMYGFQSYISLPIIRKDGTFFGTLCAIDPNPAKLNNPATIGMFKLYAELIAFHLQAIEQMEADQTTLLEERKTAQLREQFIAILGHDLKNPVGAIANCAQLMMRMSLDERTMRLANIINDSSFRMKGLIENILDFARGRMGEGIILNRNPDERIEMVLNQIIEESQAQWPDRIIEIDYDLGNKINCDGKRIAQLFSNLLNNAITHGNANEPVKVKAVCNAEGFALTVSNNGEKIPTAIQNRLFQPFSRGELKPGQQGLGLGLYIASEIAHAHGGQMNVSSNNDETSFTLIIPA